MSDIVKEYQVIARIPHVSSAVLTETRTSTTGTPSPPSGTSETFKRYVLYSTWSQRDLVRMEKTLFQKTYTITPSAEKGSLEIVANPIPVECSRDLRTTYSKDGLVKAIFSKCKPKTSTEEKEFVEIYNPIGKIASNDLSASKRHGKFYNDNEFGGFELNPVESSTHLLYVAEKYQPKSESFFSVLANKFPEDPELADKSLGQEFIYREDWGEQMVKKCQPVLCILDWADNNVSIVKNVPDGISPGQPVWTPDGSGIVFIGWENSPEKLGIVYCPIRKSRLYHLTFGEKMALPLTFTDLAVKSPRFSPDGKYLVYTETDAGGPHFKAKRLMKMDWKNPTGIPEVIVSIPEGVIKQKDFPGLYTGYTQDDLPKRCWSSDNRRIVLSTIWRSSMQIVVVNIETHTLQSLTGPAILGDLKIPSWQLLDVFDDIIVATASSPNVCPRLYIAQLPPEGKEMEIKWILIDEGGASDKDLEKEMQLMEWDVEVIKDPHSGIEFEAVWMFPSLKSNPPVVLWPHGGPHSVSLATFSIFIAALVRLEYAVIFVNYRGSAGFGEKNLRSLLGRIGQNDVEDCFRALDVVLGRKNLNNSDTDIFYQGGSHGGFLGAHLIGQFPDVFKACVLRNPVINLVTKVGASEIPDWTWVECGLEYPYENPPILPPYEKLLAHSPIIHAHKIKTPTMILLGDKDRRVPATQGLELHRALKLRGIPTKVLRYPDCNHPIDEINSESDSFVQMVSWFRTFSTSGKNP